MAEIVLMPLMSDTMTEGVVAEWHKKVGDTVENGDLLAEIETDKATMEFEAPEEGILVYHAPAGTPIPINDVLAIIAGEGEAVDVEALLKEHGLDAAAQPKPQPETEKTAETTPAGPSAEPPSEEQATAPTKDDERIKASPLAKSLAEQNKIDLRAISGTGPNGRIVKGDVEAHLKNAGTTSATAPVASARPPAPLLPEESGEVAYEEVRVSQMRKTIARRLGESKFSAPHFYLTISINMDRAVESRQRMNETAPQKISFNDLIVKAAAVALRQHPAVNASWMGDTIRYNKHINIGVAVAVDEGLLVPVIRHADLKPLSQIGAETRLLADKARNRKLQADEMTGNTFSISNLGMFGIEEFTAIINPPDSCILAVGGIEKVPVFAGDGTLAAQQRMKATLSCDHRVVDGATGAKFLQTLRELLEEPARMLV